MLGVMVSATSGEFLLGLVLGALLSAVIALGGFADSVTPDIVAERDAEVAALHRDALITLLNRRPVQVGDDYVSCRVQRVSYTDYVSDYWKGPL